MRMTKWVTINALLVAALATRVDAAPVSFSGGGFSVPDTGSASSDIVITGHGAILGSFQITLFGLSHSFVGDLVVTLTHVETGTTIDLLNRVGRVGGSGVGDSANLSGDYAFFDGATGDLWATALSSTDTAFVIPAGSYFPTTADGLSSSFIVFVGLPLTGTWRLTITDAAAGDTGSLTGWQLTADAEVPEAQSGLMMLSGLLAAIAFRSHRRTKESCRP